MWCPARGTGPGGPAYGAGVVCHETGSGGPAHGTEGCTELGDDQHVGITHGTGPGGLACGNTGKDNLAQGTDTGLGHEAETGSHVDDEEKEPRKKKVKIMKEYTCMNNTYVEESGEEAGHVQHHGDVPEDVLGGGGEDGGQHGARVMVPRRGKVRMAKRDSTRQLSMSNFLSTDGIMENERGRSTNAGSSGGKVLRRVAEIESTLVQKSEC